MPCIVRILPSKDQSRHAWMRKFLNSSPDKSHHLRGIPFSLKKRRGVNWAVLLSFGHKIICLFFSAIISVIREKITLHALRLILVRVLLPWDTSFKRCVPPWLYTSLKGNILTIFKSIPFNRAAPQKKRPPRTWSSLL